MTMIIMIILKKKQESQAESITILSVRRSDFDRCDVWEDPNKLNRSQLRGPLVTRMLVESELVAMIRKLGHRVPLTKDRSRHLQTIALDENVRSGWSRFVFALDPQVEGQILVVAESDIAMKQFWKPNSIAERKVQIESLQIMTWHGDDVEIE